MRPQGENFSLCFRQALGLMANDVSSSRPSPPRRALLRRSDARGCTYARPPRPRDSYRPCTVATLRQSRSCSSSAANRDMYSVAVGSLLAASVVLQTIVVTAQGTSSRSDAESTVDSAAESLSLPSSSDLELMASYLTQALREEPWGEHGGPLVYLEGAEDGADADDVMQSPWKRSRYYRRYPWKRQNSHDRSAQYVDDNRYMCNPTREDVFQLLVALHEAREGNFGRTVNFCNRKRPASAIFTNIRFLGKRRK